MSVQILSSPDNVPADVSTVKSHVVNVTGTAGSVTICSWWAATTLPVTGVRVWPSIPVFSCDAHPDHTGGEWTTKAICGATEGGHNCAFDQGG